MDTRTRPAVWVIGLVVAGVLLAAVVLLLGPPAVVEYEPGSPEAAAQSYVQALLDGDYDLAFDLLSPALRTDCRPHELAAELDVESLGSVVFTEVTVTGDRATIAVRLTPSVSGPGLVPGDPEEVDTRLVLQSADGGWVVVAADGPLYGCTR
jgi:hypothetical protein